MEQLVQVGTCDRCSICNSSIVYYDNYEIVCPRCGSVIGYDNIYNYYSTASRLNLYNMVSIGCKGSSISRDELSLLSNLCDRLGLPRHIAIECWRNYRKLAKYMHASSAELAMLAVYFTCKRYSYRYDESMLIDAATSIYSRSSLPTLERLVSNFLNNIYKCNDKEAIQFYITLLNDDRVRSRAIKVSMLLGKSSLKEVLSLAH